MKVFIGMTLKTMKKIIKKTNLFYDFLTNIIISSSLKGQIADDCNDQCKVSEAFVLASAALEWTPDSGLCLPPAVTIIYFTDD